MPVPWGLQVPCIASSILFSALHLSLSLSTLPFSDFSLSTPPLTTEMAAISLLAMLPVALVWMAQLVDATTFPATVEVDLIFPRNDTYAPTALFPVVFAFQNAALVPSLDPGISITLYNGASASKATVATPVLDLRNTNFTGSDPTYVSTYITGLDKLSDGAYTLNWQTSAGNCSNTNGPLTFGGGWVGTSLHFSVKKGAQQPDLVAATASCTNASHFAFNLTGTLPVTQSDQWDGHSSCAVFADVQQPQVAGNPCAVVVSAAQASNISASMTASACAAVSPVVSCPPSNNSAAAGSRAVAFSTAVLGSLVMVAFVTLQCL
jgi:hypothetical protein